MRNYNQIYPIFTEYGSSKMAATVIAKYCKWIISIEIMYRNICKGANIMFFDPRNLILTLDFTNDIYLQGTKSKMAATIIAEHEKRNKLINFMYIGLYM